jgi:type IX secretion system PorP/SprF family membrane protein
MKAVYTILIVFLNVSFLQVRAQDINFSQFYELPMLRNPALAGIFRGDIRVTSAYRNQWESVTVPYRTEALGTELRFSLGENSDDYLTIGLQITNDVAGDSKLSRVQIFPVVNFQKSINGDKDSYISAGIMAGAVQQKFDPSTLHFDDQFQNGSYSALNPTHQTFTQTNLTYGDDAAGLSYNGTMGNDSHFYIGAGLFHFTQPKVAFLKQNDIRLNEKWVFNLGMSTPVSDYDKFIMYADYFNQGGNNLFQGGFLYYHDLLQIDDDYSKGISGGVFYRWNDALVPVVKLDLFHFSFGVSYDVNISKLVIASQSRGGTEITMSYRDYLTIKNTSAQKVRCPSL